MEFIINKMEQKTQSPPDALTVLLMVSRQLETACSTVVLLGDANSLNGAQSPYMIGVIDQKPLSTVELTLGPTLRLTRVDRTLDGGGEAFDILNADGMVMVTAIECAYCSSGTYRYKLSDTWTPWMKLLPTRTIIIEGAGFDVPAEWSACQSPQESIASP